MSRQRYLNLYPSTLALSVLALMVTSAKFLSAQKTIPHPTIMSCGLSGWQSRTISTTQWMFFTAMAPMQTQH